METKENLITSKLLIILKIIGEFYVFIRSVTKLEF